ncbi:MAG TPA: glycosyltransferase family 2 protein [Geomonas sp.]|nr:glycosyltransferase family 2 protein [Geomonas sp.]
MSDCKLSICIPTYNYGGYLGETIESVLAQTFTDFELLIVDDQSKDNTREVVESYAAHDPRIRFLVNPQNLGMVRNWNHCLELARGEYVKYVFGDDLLASRDALQKMVAMLDADPKVSLVCSARNFIDENSKVMKVESHFCRTGVLPGKDVINYCLLRQGNLIGEPSVVMFRKAQAGRGFLPQYSQIVDLEMWFHLLEQGSFAYINEPLCSFRIHQKQMTQQNKASGADVDDVFYLVEDYLPKDYITLSGFMKGYVKYDHVYGVWKMQRKGRITRELAQDRIDKNYSMLKFRLWYPFYKGFKPCLKLYRSLRRMSLDDTSRLDWQ